LNEISLMSANFVAREVGYDMTGGWGQGDRATNEHFAPIETYPARFDELLAEVRGMGFESMDLWIAHLNPAWATDEHVAVARDLLGRHGLRVSSLAGGFGVTPEEFEATCRIAVAVGTRILGGMTPLLSQDRASLVSALEEHDLALAIENHPEKTPGEMLEKIGDGAGGRIGTALDTGWYGTQGYDAVKAIEELREHILLIHLKDVESPGEHVTVRYGQGCVPIEGCVRKLKEIGYGGGISVEHEPEHFDPTEDCKADLDMLKAWLGE
jgi:L-ribulose-5-phosphate 3-epimerase